VEYHALRDVELLNCWVHRQGAGEDISLTRSKGEPCAGEELYNALFKFIPITGRSLHFGRKTRPPVEMTSRLGGG